MMGFPRNALTRGKGWALSQKKRPKRREVGANHGQKKRTKKGGDVGEARLLGGAAEENRIQ